MDARERLLLKADEVARRLSLGRATVYFNDGLRGTPDATEGPGSSSAGEGPGTVDRTADQTGGGPIAMKYPWFQFYSRDWLSDLELAQCSLEARGALIGLMCLAHEGTPYGYLRNERGPFSERFLAMRCSVSVEDLHEAIAELKQYGRLEEDNGALYVPRMARDGEIRSIHAECGKLGGRPKKNQTENQNHNQTENQTHNQKPKLPLTSESDSGSPVANTPEEEIHKERGSGGKQAAPPPDDKPAATDPDPKSEFDIELEAIARAMHDRHPPNRRCGETIIKRQLKTISEKHPKRERLEVIRAIDRRHAGWCASEKWQKDDGEFANSLEKWLAPTMGRYLDEPPAPKPQPVRMMFGKGLFQ